MKPRLSPGKPDAAGERGGPVDSEARAGPGADGLLCSGTTGMPVVLVGRSLTVMVAFGGARRPKRTSSEPRL